MTTTECDRPPAGWRCTRGQHPDGTPCAAVSSVAGENTTSDPIDLDAIRDRYFGDDDRRYYTGKTPLADIRTLVAEVERLRTEALADHERLNFAVSELDRFRAELAEVTRQLAEAQAAAVAAYDSQPRLAEMGDEIYRLGAALAVCEHVLHLASPTDAQMHAAQQASGALTTEWCLTDIEDDLPDDFMYPRPVRRG